MKALTAKIVGPVPVTSQSKMTRPKPRLSYTIWFTQRTGSTLLCQSLADCGIAGRPAEWLQPKDGQSLLAHYQMDNAAALQHHLWQLGSSANGVFGLKYGMHASGFEQVLDTLRQFPGCPPDASRTAVWNHAFPNGRHIFMTRRNKVRLAVSWWKAIKSNEWHRAEGQPPSNIDLSDAYVYDAINHLYNECSMREAAIQEFFSEGKIVPLTVVYEDFIQDYEGIIKTILRFLELDPKEAAIQPPHFTRLADALSEEWVQRFREERQQGWQNRAW